MSMDSNSKSVISPGLDFFLLGGASLVLFPLIIFLFPTKVLTAYKILPAVFIAVFLLDYAVNFPHFAFSYQLMYQNFRDKLSGKIDSPLRSRYVVAGVIVPVVMIAFFLFCYTQKSTLFLRHAVNVMLLTAGWHYAKQGFGILIVTSVYRKIFYSSWERRFLLANAHLLWIYAWVMFNTGSVEKTYFGISFFTLGFPVMIERVFFYLACFTTMGLVILLFNKFRKQSVRPAVNGITAYVASVYLWIILRFGMGYDQMIHPVVLLIPFMHSMQYISVVVRLKKNEVALNHISKAAFMVFMISGVVIGALLFEAIPRNLDKWVPYDNIIYGPAFFMFVFWIFVNIHHYFIDNVIWRREGSEVQNYLFDDGTTYGSK